MTFDNYECEGQISLFDFIKPEYPDFKTMTEKEIAEYIGEVLGVRFKYNDYLEQYEVKVDKVKLTLNLSHYHPGVFGGALNISCGYDVALGGGGNACDSMEEAINYFKRAIKNNGKR